ncbi:hypothetical protein GJV06_15085 [Enterobacteriaceae bacterium RIT691]|nr:hypothetical protein [Enterobacteriaceae bacterium RIT691]
MPFRTAIKWAHRAITLGLLALVVGFWWLNYQPNVRANDALQRSYQLSERQWLYMTVSRDGGATVPTVYRYYLTGQLQGTDAAIVQQLSAGTPVIEGAGSISEARVDQNGDIDITYAGKVLTLNGSFADVRLKIKQ